MPILRNSTIDPVTLHSGHVVPAHGDLRVAPSVLDHPDNYRRLRNLYADGTLVALPDPVEPEFARETLADLSRADVSGMRKADLVLAAEGLGLDTEGTADDLRARVIADLFPESQDASAAPETGGADGDL